MNTLHTGAPIQQMKTTEQWSGPEDGLPPVGVEFQFSLNGFIWEDRVMLFNDGITCLMANKRHPANRWHYKCDEPDILFRPLKTEKDRVVEWALSQDCEPDEGTMFFKEFCEAFYDAGAFKMPGPKQ